MDTYFKKIIARNDVMYLKPNPEGFNLIFKVGGGEKSDYVMIGDSSSDRGAAEAAGIDFVHVSEL